MSERSMSASSSVALFQSPTPSYLNTNTQQTHNHFQESGFTLGNEDRVLQVSHKWIFMIYLICGEHYIPAK